MKCKNYHKFKFITQVETQEMMLNKIQIAGFRYTTENLVLIKFSRVLFTQYQVLNKVYIELP